MDSPLSVSATLSAPVPPDVDVALGKAQEQCHQLKYATIEDETPQTAGALPGPPLLDVDDILRKAQQQSRQLATLRDATSSFVRRDARLEQLRERTSLLRSRAKIEWKNCHDYRRFVRESQEAFNEEAAAIMFSRTAEDHDERLARLQSLHDQVIRDFQSQNEFGERANALQTELSGLEHELRMKESSVKEAVDDMKHILSELVLPGYSSAATAVDTDAPLSASTAPSDDLDPLIEYYFQKAGVVNDLIGLSLKLEEDYREACAERWFKSEHEQDLNVPNDDFEASWQHRRDTIAKEIADARRIADRARNTCVNNGHDPGKYRRRPQKDSDRSVSDSVLDDVSQLLPPDIDPSIFEAIGLPHASSRSPEVRSDFPLPAPDVLGTRFSNTAQRKRKRTVLLQDRVLDWMREVDGQETSAESPRSGVIRADLLARRPHSVQTVLDSSPRMQSESILSDVAHRASSARRRYSDSDTAALLSTHDPGLDFDKGSRIFAVRGHR